MNEKNAGYRMMSAFTDNAGYFIGGTVLLGIGAWLLFDDIHDFARFSYPGHESPFHHWWYGAILIIVAFLVLAMGFLLSLATFLATQT